jgi:hypothetical protein
MKKYPLRELELADLAAALLIAPGEGPRQFLALLVTSDFGGGADGVHLLGVAPDLEAVLALTRASVKAQGYEEDGVAKAGVKSLLGYDPQTQIPLEIQAFEEELVVLSVPVGARLDLNLHRFPRAPGYLPAPPALPALAP